MMEHAQLFVLFDKMRMTELSVNITSMPDTRSML